MKLFKSILLIAACHAAQASAAIDINADPKLTGAAPLTGILNGQQSDTQNMSGFDNTPPPTPPVVMSRMFGAQLFNGTSADSGATVGFNPDYILNPGDSIQVRLWGAFTFDGALQVDPKGNIFLPNVGPVKVAGVSNSQLNALVTSKVKEVYQSNVNVYASLLQAQPVKVYVTGFVRNPGLYGGVTSDSLLNYLIKAGGVDPERGSYVDIVVKRGNRVRSNVNLYDFLLNGKLGLSQFADGDTIIVGPRQHTFSVQGDVFNSYDFEFRESSIPVTEALSWARPKPGATHITIMRKQGLQKRSEYYPISSAPGRMLQNGDTLIVSTDRYAGTIQVRVEGAHSGEHAMVLPYGSTMRAVLEKVRPNSMSQMNAVQLYRPSVAQRQKEMLNLSLQKLEEASLSAQSSTKEEASLRMQEAQLISRFVAKARTVVPKGEVILNESNIDSVLLEDGDVINIPEKTSLVMVHGEVLFPNAVSWQKGMTTEDYIEKCGGLTQKSGITVEEGGVNAYSSLPRDPDFYRKLPDMPAPHVENLTPSTMKRIGHAMWYYLIGWHYRHEFPRYRHHKSFSPWYEARCWVRAYWRKQLYKVTQRKVLPRLMNELDQRYYLAVLQVYNDSQIRNHSNYNDVRDYINEVMYSFSRKAPKESYLVIKHHPMDRGHRLYRPLIKRLSKEYGLGERVIYVHDLPMPELLRHAKAVVTINSTAGISALIHNKPLKVMGNALYDIKGLTYQGHLHQFWQADFKPDMKLFKKFRGYLLVKTQVNGVYYGGRCFTITL